MTPAELKREIGMVVYHDRTFCTAFPCRDPPPAGARCSRCGGGAWWSEATLPRFGWLERATGANGVDVRVYGSAAEAAADTRPVGPGTEMQIIVRALFARWTRREGACASGGAAGG